VPCLEIERNPDLAYDYTAKGNLVAVVTNGTAVLGLGAIGPLAGKPVMEGKGVLFKRFADVDVFDIEIASNDPEEIIRVCTLLEPTFGGINLEDIKAPECFVIEEKLQSLVSIPVFHDDQHGTAIITGAALKNAVEVTGRKMSEIRVVILGAGASGIASARLFTKLGLKKEQITMCDRKGVIHKGRLEELNPYKAEFARDTDARTLADALRGADVLLGLSGAGLVTQEMVRSISRRQGRASRRDHGDRPVRLSEPGEQRPRLPVPVPRGARRARPAVQRRDEARRGRRARRSREAGRARRRRPRLRRRDAALRTRLPDPQAVRSARAALGGSGRG
jgi:malate dehydrogenase (oxaloacetate-decarboxylating)(NADP+)